VGRGGEEDVLQRALRGLAAEVANLLNGVNVNLLGGALVNTLTTLLNNLVGALAGR
jgi:hypothetical protein